MSLQQLTPQIETFMLHNSFKQSLEYQFYSQHLACSVFSCIHYLESRLIIKVTYTLIKQQIAQVKFRPYCCSTRDEEQGNTNDEILNQLPDYIMILSYVQKKRINNTAKSGGGLDNAKLCILISGIYTMIYSHVFLLLNPLTQLFLKITMPAREEPYM